MPRSLAVVVALILVPVVRAENWPEFRGPTGQGHAKGPLPTEWGPDKNIAWKQEIPGSGWSSPVVWDGRVYLTSAVPARDGAAKDLSLRALCLDAATGKILWDVEALKQPGNKVPRSHTKNSNASPTPVVAGKHLYVHFGHLGTACLDLDGKVVWRNTDLGYAPVHGNGGSPILVDDLLVFSIDGADKQFLVALEKGTGKVKWQTDRKSTAENTFSFSTPLLVETKDRRQIVSPASDMVAGYDPTTGKEIWRVRYEGYSLIPRPVFGHGLLFVGTGYNTPSLMAVRADGKGDVTETHVAWSIKGGPHTPSALLDGNELYIVTDNGIAKCLDAKTGEAHWTQRLAGGFSSSPLLADGKVYFQNEDGTTFVVKAGKKYELVSKNAMKERTLASFAVADGAIFLRTAEHLYRIEKPKGIAALPEIVAHRGASEDAPENTVAAIKLAWEQKADASEFDLWLSRDGKIVVIHDNNTKRTAGVDKPVADQTLDELRKLDAGKWKGDRFAGEKIPTLDDMLGTIPAGKRVFMEIKCGAEALTEVDRVLKASKREPEQTTVICSAAPTIAAWKKLRPDGPAYWIASLKPRKDEKPPTAESLIAKAREIKADGLLLAGAHDLDAAFVKAVKAAGLKCFISVVNDEDTARRLAGLGVDGFTTDRPGRMREQLVK